jgi:uncharacterized protein (TIGR02145 family)
MKKITLLFLLGLTLAETQAQNYQITFTGTGASNTIDSVKVENLTQCSDTSLGGGDILHLAASFVGINEMNIGADNTMHIYPNPITGACTINFEATAQGTTTIGLYDIIGKRILQVQQFLSKGNHAFNLSGIDNGIYTLIIASDKFSYTTKIICNNAQAGNADIKYIGSAAVDKQSKVPNTAKKTGEKSVINMQYNTGDMLKFTGSSADVYKTVFMLVPDQTQTVTFNFIHCADADSNHYEVVQIDTMIWMAENLKTSKFMNGDPIPNVTANAEWKILTTAAYSDYANIPFWGRLYNFFAVEDSLKICPAGWHVSSDAEWTSLTTYLGGLGEAGGKLKKNCTGLWQPPNVGATNETGFTAFAGGLRIDNTGDFNGIGLMGTWWSSSEGSSASTAWYRQVNYNNNNVNSGDVSKKFGFSVRCVMDH